MVIITIKGLSSKTDLKNGFDRRIVEGFGRRIIKDFGRRIIKGFGRRIAENQKINT